MAIEDLNKLPVEAIYPAGSTLLRDTVKHGADKVYFDWEKNGNRRDFWDYEAMKIGMPNFGQVFSRASSDANSQDAINLRIKEFKVSAKGLAVFKQEAPSYMTPGFLLSAKALRELGVEVGILSSGFEETIPELGFPISANVFALQPGNSNKITSFHDDELLAQRKGKLLFISEQRRNGTEDKRVVMIGDGLNDAVTQSQALFILHTGVIRREDVIEKLKREKRLPPVIINDFAEGLVIVAGEPRWRNLMNNRNLAVKAHFQKGAQRIIGGDTEFLRPLDRMEIASRLEYFINRG